MLSSRQSAMAQTGSECVVCHAALESRSGASRQLVKTSLKHSASAAEFLTKYHVVSDAAFASGGGPRDVCARCLASVLACDSIMDLFLIKLEEMKVASNSASTPGFVDIGFVDLPLSSDVLFDEDDSFDFGDFKPVAGAARPAGNVSASAPASESTVERGLFQFDSPSLSIRPVPRAGSGQPPSNPSTMLAKATTSEQPGETAASEVIGIPQSSAEVDQSQPSTSSCPSIEEESRDGGGGDDEDGGDDHGNEDDANHSDSSSSDPDSDDSSDEDYAEESAAKKKQPSSSSSGAKRRLTAAEALNPMSKAFPDTPLHKRFKFAQDPDKRYCEECDAPFSSNVQLFKHYRSRHVHPHGPCWECARSFDTVSEFEDHARMHYEAIFGKVTCIDCRRVMNAEGFRAHAEKVHGEKLARSLADRDAAGAKYQKCRLCTYVSTVNLQYEIHMCQAHPGERPFYCKICGRAFSLRESLRTHTAKKHDNAPRFRCDVCPASFYNAGAYKDHMREHAKPNRRAKLCTECGEVIPHTSIFNHRARHQKEKGEYQYLPCTMCDNRYESKRSLQRHMAKVHNVGQAPPPRPCDQPIACEKCGRVFRTKDLWIGHMFKDHGEKLPGLRTWNCEHCDKIFYVRNHFANHVRKVHGDVSSGEFVCKICLWGEPERRGFIAHLKSEHNVKATRENFAEYLQSGLNSLPSSAIVQGGT